MKKFLLLFTVASAALVSCVNDESLDFTQQPKKLSFATPVMGTQSRTNVAGEICGTTYPTNENFAAFAWQYKEEDENRSVFWEGQKTWKYSGDNWSVTIDDKSYYWPKAPYKLAFSAYSPATLNGTVTYKTEDGLTVTDFSVDGTVSNQLDFMYTSIDGCTEAVYGTTGVPLKFNHALSSIVFAAIDNDDNADYEIQSIKIKGKFQIKGTFKEKSSSKWSGNPETSEVTYNPSVCESSIDTDENSVFEVPSTQAAEFTYGTSALLMIPQDVPNDATITIEYKVKPNTGAPSYVVNTDTQNGTDNPIKLKDFLIGGAASSFIEEWEVGKRYTYLIQFGGSKKIFFKPEVTNWATGNNAQISI